jgi:hypothetical protein
MPVVNTTLCDNAFSPIVVLYYLQRDYLYLHSLLFSIVFLTITKIFNTLLLGIKGNLANTLW